MTRKASKFSMEMHIKGKKGSYLGSKEQKAMFLVVSRSDAHFCLAHKKRSGAKFYLRAQNIGSHEVNLPKHDLDIDI